MVASDRDGNFVNAWSGLISGSFWILRTAVDSGGTKVGDEILVGSAAFSSHKWPDIAMNDSGRIVVVWTTSDGNDTGSVARVYTANGTAVSDAFRVNGQTTGAQQEPKVAIDNDGSFVIAWWGVGPGIDTSQEWIYADRYSSAGVKQSKRPPLHAGC